MNNKSAKAGISGHSFVAYVAISVAIVGAFLAGRYIGQHDAEKAIQAGIPRIQADHAAEVFKLASSARLALKASMPEQATQILTTWAALKAPALIECRSSPACAAWVGTSMPTQAQLDEVLAAPHPPAAKP
jgi:hypothetical protein